MDTLYKAALTIYDDLLEPVKDLVCGAGDVERLVLRPPLDVVDHLVRQPRHLRGLGVRGGAVTPREDDHVAVGVDRDRRDYAVHQLRSDFYTHSH